MQKPCKTQRNPSSIISPEQVVYAVVVSSKYQIPHEQKNGWSKLNPTDMRADLVLASEYWVVGTEGSVAITDLGVAIAVAVPVPVQSGGTVLVE